MNIVVFAFDGMTALDAIGPYDVLARMPGAELRLAGLERGVVRTERGPLGIQVDSTLNEVSRADLQSAAALLPLDGRCLAVEVFLVRRE